MRQVRRARTAGSAAPALTVDLGILMFTALAVLTTLTISSSLLTHWKIQYVTAGGNFYEKLHPATYFVVLALCLALLRNANPIQADRSHPCAASKAILFYLVCWLFLLVQTIQLERPFTGSSTPSCCRC